MLQELIKSRQPTNISDNTQVCGPPDLHMGHQRACWCWETIRDGAVMALVLSGRRAGTENVKNAN